MNISIEKATNAYNSFFADMSVKGMNRNVSGDSAVGFIGGMAEEDFAGFFGYDKNSNLTGEAGENPAKQRTADENIREFLNNAVEVLKNLVTDEDYSRMAELGITADKDDLGTIVTVYERIQIRLAAYGDGDIASSLNISSNKIDKVLKTPVIANAVKDAESIGDIDDNAKEYLLKNHLEPTVENVYIAVHSSESKSTAKHTEMTEEQWEQLKPQIEKFLEKNGIEADEEVQESARWLLEREIPVTVKNLVNYMKLKEIESADSRDMESVKANMVMAEVFGVGAAGAYMTSGWMDADRAKNAAETIENADRQTVDYLMAKGFTLNVANLNKYKEMRQEAVADESPENERRTRHARQVLAEAKAVMTMEGMLLMEKLGVDVTYTDIEEMIRLVKAEEKDYVSAFLEKTEEIRAGFFMDVMQILAQMPAMPIAAIGMVAQEDNEFYIRHIYDEGVRLKNAYERAGETYEAVGTEVRPDLGDNIKKAFANTDTLIKETGLEPDDYYRRAARILGYNSMEITKDNLVLMAEKASEVDRVIKNITPKTAAYLIEHGINPLETDIEELNDRLEQINETIGADENEEYGKYLWKLEKNRQITKEERAAYIELYRAIKTIEKADTRAIGAVVNEGAALTLGNLLSAEQSRTKYGTSTSVDDKTGYYQGRLVKNKLAAILESIGGNEKAETEDTDDMLMPENRTVEELWETVVTRENAEKAKEMDGKYMQEVIKDMQSNIATFSEDMLYGILDGGMQYSLANMSAAALLLRKDSEMRMLLKNRLHAENHILDGFTGQEEAEKAYETLNAEASRIYGEELDEGADDFMKYRNLYSVTGFMTQAAGNKCYNVPMDINGREVLVRVKFSHKNESAPFINITMNDETLGDIKAGLTVENNRVSGYILCDREEVKEHISENMEVLNNRLSIAADIVVTSGENGQQEDSMESSDAAAYSNRELYDISKSFLMALKDWGKMPINKID